MSDIVKRPETLIDRLRGIYRIPITDGLGAVGAGEEPDNPNEFVRHFETSPIQRDAADTIERLTSALTPFADAAVALDMLAEWRDAEQPAFYTSVDGFDAAAPVTVGDFRAARAALKSEPSND